MVPIGHVRDVGLRTCRTPDTFRLTSQWDANAELVIGWRRVLASECRRVTKGPYRVPRGSVPSSGSDVPEGEYSEVAQSSRSPQNDYREGTRSPSVKLVDAVLQLQKDMEEFRASLDTAAPEDRQLRFRPLVGLGLPRRQCPGMQGGLVGTSIAMFLKL